MFVGDDPVLLVHSPLPAIRGLFLRNGEIILDDIGLSEVGEAFASIPLT